MTACFLILTLPGYLTAQNNGNNNNVGGIRIDAEGVVTLAIEQDRTGRLDKQRKKALAKQTLPGDVSRASEARCLSLTRLESACESLLTQNERLPRDIQFLAGLTRIDQIYIDADQHDLILCGPAEPFTTNSAGRTVGIESGRPVLRLDDFLVAWRAGRESTEMGCSIDPDPARLGNLQAFIKQNSTATTPDVISQRFRQMREILGHHRVRFHGVPENSHFARGLFEADYRMKVLALGLETPGVKGFKSHLALAGSGNAMERWWFVPLYDQISRTADGLAYEFAGPRAQLLGENELANAQGHRSKAAKNKVSTLAFSKQFTVKFPELAERMPVFAELQQLIDWTILAALIRHERLDERAGWSTRLFHDSARLPHEVYTPPLETDCLLNTKLTGSGVIVGQLSGGVTIRAEDVVKQMLSGRVSDAAKLSERRAHVLKQQPALIAQWWWD